MSEKPKQASTVSQLALPIGLSDKACFENYWIGDNEELISVLQQMVQVGEPKLVYFYGTNGAGKSHLMYAVMRLALKSDINTSYLALSDLHPDMAATMLETVDVSSIVCVDDVEAWASNAQAEDALFTLFEQIKHAGGQLLVNACVPPNELSIELPDLISRLASGLVYPLQALDDQQQFHAVKMRADYRGISIPDDAVKYLLTRLPRNTNLLFTILDKIDQASLIEKRKITIPFLQSLLKNNQLES